MTKEEKRTLFCKLLEARQHGDGPARLAKWLGGSASAVYLWMKPGGPWPNDEEKEARIWAFFDYEVDKRGNPILKKGAEEKFATTEQEPSLSTIDILKQTFDEYIQEQERRVESEEVNRILVNTIVLAIVDAKRRPIVSAPTDTNDKPRQSQKVIDTEKKTKINE